MTRHLKQVVALHIEEDGSFDLKVWGDGDLCVLWVDERSPDDRVYEQTHRESDPAKLRELIGSASIGNAGDGKVTPEMEQAIRAMAWRLAGNRLDEA